MRCSMESKSAGGSGRPLPGTRGTTASEAADLRGMGGNSPSRWKLARDPKIDHVSGGGRRPRREDGDLEFFETAPRLLCTYGGSAWASTQTTNSFSCFLPSFFLLLLRRLTGVRPVDIALLWEPVQSYPD